MIRILHRHMQPLADAARHRFIDSLCRHLRSQFPDELWGLGKSLLYGHVDSTLMRAASYGLQSEQDLCRYLNLAVLFGWEFDRQEEYAWMRGMLSDAGVSSPGLRLKRVIDQCIHRAAVAERNRRLFQAYDAALREDAGDDDPGDDGIGMLEPNKR